MQPAVRNTTIGNEGKKKRRKIHKTGVDYSPEYSFVKEKSPSYSMGYRLETEINYPRPGPADYKKVHTEQSFNRTEHYFTVAKRADSSNNKSLAGGYYNISPEYFNKSAKVRFGTSTRPNTGLNVASPGIYYRI
jgi:hypothetical protein